MKVIDLYNKIANGEEIPEKIKYLGINFSFQHNLTEYVSDDGTCLIRGISGKHLTDEVEIIEEEKEIPEKLNYCKENTFMEQKETTYLSPKERTHLDSNFKEIGNKINEIIDYLDYLKSKGE